MPTIKELDLQEGQRAFVFSVEKRLSPNGMLGGLHLADALADPKTKVDFALVEVIKHGEKYSTMLRLICTTDVTHWSKTSPDFPDIQTKDIIFIHNLYPNYIIDSIGPKDDDEISIGVEASDKQFQKNLPLFNPKGEIVGELVIDNTGMRWSLDTY